MRILHVKFAPNVRLPFNVIKGNASQRDQKSKAYFAKFYNRIQEITKDKKSCPLRQTCMILKEVLAPYDIPFELLKEKIKNNDGSFRMNEKFLEVNDHYTTVLYDKYNVFLSMNKSKNIIHDKYALYHEIQHFFDHLFNPKYIILKEDKIIINQNLFNKKNMLLDTLFEDIYSKKNMKTIKQELIEILSDISITSKIYLLQEMRYKLQTEINAYSVTVKCLIKDNQFIKAFQESKFFYQNCKFVQKLNFIDKLLKTLLKQERTQTKEYFTNLQHNPNNLAAL